MLEDLRDPEVEQLGVTLSGDEHVARLEIAVDDVMVVGVLHGVDHTQTEPDSFGRVQPVLVGVAIDRRAGHVLHHEVRQAVRRRAAIEERRDVRMVERGENLTLVPEAADDKR